MSDTGFDGSDLAPRGQEAPTGGRNPRRRRGGGGRGGERKMVPDAEFTSYYGRPVVKASPWETDIPAYLFLGGLAGGSALLAAGADLTDRPALRKTSRFGSLIAILLSFAALIHDLGRPARFTNMLRVAKPTSPMSVGTWILSGFAPLIGVAAAAEVRSLLPRRLSWVGSVAAFLARPAGLGAAAAGSAVASYTAVLIADTATPTWHEGYRELPMVFVLSAASASGGLGMIGAPVDQAGPARRMALGGALGELAVEMQMERSMGITAEPLHAGTPGKLMKASRALTLTGAAGTLLAGRSRIAAVLAGSSLLAGSACLRFGIFYGGQASAHDPKYTVVPQRERADARR